MSLFSRGRILPEILALAALFTMFGFLAAWYPSVPGKVPSHFGLTGQPDAWSGKTSLFVLPAVGIGLYVLLTVSAMFPQMANLPGVDKRNMSEAQKEIARKLLSWLKAQVAVLFAYIEIQSMRIAFGDADGLSVLALPAMLIVTLGTVGWFAWRARKAG